MNKNVNDHSMRHHWPIITLACLVVVIFLIAMMTFQVKETEYAVIKTFGKAKVDANGSIVLYEPGLHMKWPFVDQVWRHDKRIQCYELNKGHLEQSTTKDDYQIVVSTYVLWRVGDPAIFLKRLKSTEEVDEKLDSAVRNCRHGIIARHNFKELVSTETGAGKMEEIENEMLAAIRKEMTQDFGIEVIKVGFRQLGFPEQVTTKVFDRMRAEREKESLKRIAEGKQRASKIRTEADTEASKKLAQAEADAKKTRAEGDAEAAESYKVFQQNPELAIFLRKLDAFKQIWSDKDTLILDTNTPPLDILKPDFNTKKDAEKTESTSK